jgi:hypothetical protein
MGAEPRVLTEQGYARARKILDHGGWTGLDETTIQAVRNSEPFSSFGLAGLKDVDDFGQLSGGFTMPRVGTPARDQPVPRHPRSR